MRCGEARARECGGGGGSASGRAFRLGKADHEIRSERQPSAGWLERSRATKQSELPCSIVLVFPYTYYVYT